MSDPLAWLDSQRETMTRLLIEWAEINSGTKNLAGLSRLADDILREFASLGGDAQLIDLAPAESIDSRGQVVRAPLGKAISITKQSKAPLRILLSIHYDTVFGVEHPFQRTRLIDQDTLNGPGVVDAKGGLVVMLTALRALEMSELRDKIGWEVLIGPDEEIGSPGTRQLLFEAAKRNQFGLVFEPAMPDGNLVGARKGSATFTTIIRGRAAHSGRDFQLGRSAILAAAQLIQKIDESQRALGGDVTINCGKIEGGSAVNIVADLAIARFNARASNAIEQREIESLFHRAIEDLNRRDGINATLHGAFFSPPKPLDEPSTKLMNIVIDAGRELGLSLSHKPSGGACDGNKLAAAGLPVVDTMGPVGGELHSEREYVKLDSLVERAKLTFLALALVLARLGRSQ